MLCVQQSCTCRLTSRAHRLFVKQIAFFLSEQVTGGHKCLMTFSCSNCISLHMICEIYCSESHKIVLHTEPRNCMNLMGGTIDITRKKQVVSKAIVKTDVVVVEQDEDNKTNDNSFRITGMLPTTSKNAVPMHLFNLFYLA